MTFLAAVVFPAVSIFCALAVAVALVRFIAEIWRDSRRDTDQ